MRYQVHLNGAMPLFRRFFVPKVHYFCSEGTLFYRSLHVLYTEIEYMYKCMHYKDTCSSSS